MTIQIPRLKRIRNSSLEVGLGDNRPQHSVMVVDRQPKRRDYSLIWKHGNPRISERARRIASITTLARVALNT